MTVLWNFYEVVYIVLPVVRAVFLPQAIVFTGFLRSKARRVSLRYLNIPDDILFRTADPGVDTP